MYVCRMEREKGLYLKFVKNIRGLGPPSLSPSAWSCLLDMMNCSMNDGNHRHPGTGHIT